LHNQVMRELAGATTPVLMLAPDKDVQCTLASALQTFGAIGSARKRFLEVRLSLFSADVRRAACVAALVI
jgi:hypothetical protein